jgi:hypothetical protein
MNAEDTEAMRSLDIRLRRLHAGLDARPGFEDRLAARVADLRAQRARPLPTEAVHRIEREYERARARFDRDAKVEGLLLAVAGLGGVLAVWQLVPELAHLLAAATHSTGPAAIAFGALPLAVALMWAVLRRFDVDPRALVGA